MACIPRVPWANTTKPIVNRIIPQRTAQDRRGAVRKASDSRLEPNLLTCPVKVSHPTASLGREKKARNAGVPPACMTLYATCRCTLCQNQGRNDRTEGPTLIPTSTSNGMASCSLCRWYSGAMFPRDARLRAIRHCGQVRAFCPVQHLMRPPTNREEQRYIA